MLILTTSYPIIEALGNLTITAIGIYTAYITFKHRIKFVGWTNHSSLWEGYYFTVSIQNQSLSALSIRKVEMVLDNKKILLVKEFKEPLFVESFKTVKISSAQTNNDLIGSIYKDNISVKLLVFCSSGKIISTNFKRKKNKKFDETKYDRIAELTKIVDGVTLNDTMKYFVYLKKDNEVTKIIISKAGFISEPIGGYNVISNEIINDKTAVKGTLESLINNKDYTIDIYDVSQELKGLVSQIKR